MNKVWWLGAFWAVSLYSVAWATSTFDAAIQAYERGDYAEARDLWEQAVSEGDWTAARSLGTLYRKGLGVPPDQSRAAAYYRQAMDHGVITAEANLAEMMIAGQGVAQDIPGAKALLRHAADNGLVAARFRLGEIEDAESRGEQISAVPLSPMGEAPDQSHRPTFSAPAHALVNTLPNETAATVAWLNYNLPGLEGILEVVHSPDRGRVVRLWAEGPAETIAELCRQMAARGEICLSLEGVTPSAME